MELTAGASFLNMFFASYDEAILSFLHSLRCGPLTFLFKALTFIGEKGVVFFAIALVLMMFSNTRKTGICLFGAVACGALITNVILKDMIARPRPFNFEPYLQWWKDVGSPAEDGFSFPSGHVTAAAAGMTAIYLRKRRGWLVPAVVVVVLMCVARNYLMAHYPSDVLAAAIIGIVSAVIAWAITNVIYGFLKKNQKKPWSQFIRKWDIRSLSGNKAGSYSGKHSR